jgi:thiamine kinase-like enzyme
MTDNVNYMEKATADYRSYLGVGVEEAQMLHNGRQNTIVSIRDVNDDRSCVRYRTAVEFWYEDCIKEPFIESLRIVDMPTVRAYNDAVRPQMLISEFVDGDLLHVSGVSEEAASKVGKLIAQVHISSKGASTYMDFVRGQVSSEAWADQFLASLKEEILACGFDNGDADGLLKRCSSIFTNRTQDVLVLVHNDIHFKNLISRPTGSICLIDWDSVVIAPAEKDFVKLLDWSHANTTVVPAIIESYKKETNRTLDMDAIEVFRIYACLRQIHFQTASMQKGMDSSILAQKGFFDDNQKQYQRICAALTNLDLPHWRSPKSLLGVASNVSLKSNGGPR